MSIFHSMNNSASALTAQRLRMDVISSNMANTDSTRARLVNGEWQPYRRKLVVFQPNDQGFSNFLNAALNTGAPKNIGSGVKVTKVIEDPSPFRQIYEPENPEANADGYVQLPNVDPLREMVDLMSATRSYEANVTVLNASKNMLMKAMEIGK